MMLFEHFDLIFIVFFILFACGFIFSLAMIFSARTRAKMMGVQVKAMHQVVEDNAEALKDIADISADVSKDAVTTTVHAIKKGIVEDELLDARDMRKHQMFCKHCGAAIDDDSKFCKECGKEV